MIPTLTGHASTGKTHLARRIVAEVELATPASERRLVQTDDFNETGRVYLELADATPAWAATP
jgi:chromosomal replication initiation ATPase DnaA